MKSIIVYSSKSGNTQKIADAIASGLCCESVKITKANTEDSLDLTKYDLIFLGTGIHYGNPNEDLLAFMKNSKFSSTRQFAIFVTWGGAGKTNQDVVARLKTILEEKGQKVHEKYFFCYGGWNLLRRGHPNPGEIWAAKEWAKQITQN